MAEIELDQVSKRFPDGTFGVKCASATIHDGEFFVLVGPSGCGKSTLLNMIVGLESISEGEIRVDGKRVNELDPKERNMAMVFQSYAIYPHMTVRENLAFPLKLAKLPRDEINSRVESVAETLELAPLLDRKPRALSGGQRQRVAMGRAIVREPAAFLLDEPLSNLDAKLRMQMRTELARLQKRLGATMVYVTHDQTEAMTLGDRIAVLRKGEIQQIGTPRELYERPQNLFVAGFIGAPPMNLLPVELGDNRLILPMTTLDVSPRTQQRLAPYSAHLIAGVRPEHVTIVQPQGEAPPGTFRVTVDVVEWTGADLYAHFILDVPEGVALPPDLPYRFAQGKGTLVARLDPTSRLKEGDMVTLRLDLQRLHVFDIESERRLMPE